MEENQLTLPDTSKEELANFLMEFSMGFIYPIPGLSSTLRGVQELINSRIRKKYQAFYLQIIARLEEFDRRMVGFIKEPDFHSALLRVLPLVRQQKLDEKISIFSKAIVNVVITDVEYDEAFFDYIDRLDLSHIQLLKLFDEHAKDIKDIESYRDLYIFFKTNAFIHIEKDKFRYLCQCLANIYLINIPPGIEEVKQSKLLLEESEKNEDYIRITEIGRHFLNFIS